MMTEEREGIPGGGPRERLILESRPQAAGVGGLRVGS